MNRLQARLAKLDDFQPALSPYFMLHYPNRQASLQALRDAREAGCCWIEVGLPFSDPAADGPVIEQAGVEVLASGIQFADQLDLLRAYRSEDDETPLVAMTYANVLYVRGWDESLRLLAEAGVDALILPDVPHEEAAPVKAACARVGILWIPLLAPTTPKERRKAIVADAQGFVYLVGRVGTTGTQGLSEELETLLQDVREDVDLPVGLGFGVRTPEDVRRVLAAGADAAIIGSALVERMRDDPEARLLGHLQSLRQTHP